MLTSTLKSALIPEDGELSSSGKEEAQVEHIALTPRVESACVSITLFQTTLKVQCFQAVGFKFQN